MEEELCAQAPYGKPPTMPKQDDDMIFAVLFRQLLRGAGLTYPVNRKVQLHLPGGHTMPLDTMDQVEAVERHIYGENNARKLWAPK